MEKAIKRYFPIFLLPTLVAFMIGFVVPFLMGIWLSSRVWPLELMPVLSEVFPFSLLGVAVAFGVGRRGGGEG